jgi:hypothetical protein
MKLIVNSTLILGLNIMPSLATLSIAQVAITQPQSSQGEALRQLLCQAKQLLTIELIQKIEQIN